MIEMKLNSLNVPEIEEFIDKHDEERIFSSKENYHNNFLVHFLKLLGVNQVLSFREDGKLIGFCSWAMVTKQTKSQINKVRWTLPDDVVNGDILYVDVCILDNQANIFDIRKYLTNRYRGQMKEAFWFNVGAGKVFRKKFKREAICQTVG